MSLLHVLVGILVTVAIVLLLVIVCKEEYVGMMTTSSRPRPAAGTSMNKSKVEERQRD